MDMYGFYTGKVFNAYEYLGCHVQEKGCVFRVYAPHARRIAVIGDFNAWTETSMQQIFNGQFWECFIEDAKEGQYYKYRVYQHDGNYVEQ